MKPLRVLVVGWTATTGGIEHFLMAYCGKMNRERVQFDFLCRFSPIACQKEAEKIGKIYTITRRSSDVMRYYREINDFFREHGHEYDIIWDNECMFNDMTPLKKAAEVGIPVRIAHCHNPQNMDKSVIGHVRGFLHRVNHHSLGRYANVLWACSMESAKWACPAMDLPCEVIPNAIDAQMFCFSEQVPSQLTRLSTAATHRSRRLKSKSAAGISPPDFPPTTPTSPSTTTACSPPTHHSRPRQWPPTAW